ncbi:phospholipase A2 inhibitor gamma subunit B-like [Lithobates pipiens]
MNSILAFLVFSGVIATGSAKSCITCEAHGDVNNCAGDLQECPNDDDFCVTQKESSIIGTDIKITVKKSCMPASNKNVCRPEPMTLDCGKMTFYVYSECCFEDQCNSNGLQMPAISTEKNGRQCPTCFVENEDVCPESATEMKDCTGHAKTCFDFSGNVQRPESEDKLYSFKGCADGNLCTTDLTLLPGCKVGSNAKFTCS